MVEVAVRFDEAGFAEVAVVALLGAVGLQVLREVALLREAFLAELALVDLLSSVDANMVFRVALFCEVLYDFAFNVAALLAEMLDALASALVVVLGDTSKKAPVLGRRVFLLKGRSGNLNSNAGRLRRRILRRGRGCRFVIAFASRVLIFKRIRLACRVAMGNRWVGLDLRNDLGCRKTIHGLLL